MRDFYAHPLVATLAALGLIALAPRPALPAEAGGAQAFDLHPGQELTFAAAVQGGKVTLGPPHAAKLGAAQPKDGEMTVGLTLRDKTGYEQVIVTEKTSLPIDFVATALVGNIEIDERVLCGRLDAPSSSRIGANNWRVRLHDFEVGRGGAACE